jgi:hypothetical protein
MRAVSLRLLAVASLLVVASCDSATAPAPIPSSNSANHLLLAVPQTVKVVTRNTVLASPVTASATIGLLGGHINMPSVGLKVVVPPLSLTRSTKITVTAVAGKQLAYEFEPHGTRFLVPLIVTQDLRNTSASGSGGLLNSLLSGGIFAGYFASTTDLNQSGGTALVSELLGVVLNLSSQSATFTVFHFSGYLVAMGDNMSQSDASGSVGR